MQKIFLAICFISLLASSAVAKVEEVLDINSVPKPQQTAPQSNPEVQQMTPESLGEFVKQRIQSTVIEDASKVTSGAIFVEPSELARQSAKEAQKGTYEKIYDEAMRRANTTPETPAYYGERPDLQSPNNQLPPSIQQQQAEWSTPNFPVINVLLPPDDRRVVVPAREHIPYLMNNIEIMPDGLIKFNETLVVIAGGEKLKNGLTKSLPRYIYSRNGERQKIDYTLIKVTVNNQDVPYKLIESGEQVLLIPQTNYVLEPGVYTYNFQYLNDRALWDYQNFREFYWDVSGSSWNLVITQAGATITLPPAVTPLGQQAYAGYANNLRNDLINLIHPAPATWGFAAQVPLYVGEGFHIILSLPEDSITTPTFGKRLVNRFDKQGDVIISALALILIWLSFKISGRYIKANKGQLKISLRKNAAMLRYLAFNRFDKISFMSFLLELYRKNIIDIQQADSTILLIKRTDNLQSLTKAERQAVGQLFSGNDAVFNVNRGNLLKIRRATELLEKELHSKLWLYMLKLNSGYLFFSLGMLLLAELFIALLQLNPLEIWSYLAAGSVIMLGGILLFNRKEPRLWQQIVFKTLGALFVMGAFVIMSGFISPLATILLLSSLVVIEIYTTVYAQRGGLLKEQINEAAKLRQHLQEHKDNIMLGREIINQQPNILALNLADEFVADENKNEFYKLDTIAAILQKLSN